MRCVPSNHDRGGRDTSGHVPRLFENYRQFTEKGKDSIENGRLVLDYLRIFFRKLAGVLEVADRNWRVKALWSVKPHASAMSETDTLVEAS